MSDEKERKSYVWGPAYGCGHFPEPIFVNQAAMQDVVFVAEYLAWRELVVEFGVSDECFWCYYKKLGEARE